MAMTPATRSEVIENRAFLRRAVRYLASRYLALSHGVVLDDPEFVGQVARNWDRAASGVVMRTRDEVAGFLAGFDLVPPGLVTTVEWGTGRPPATGACSVLAAVGTLPATPPKESG